VSSELLALLKRTQKPTPIYKKPPSEPSPEQNFLLSRMEMRRWKADTLELTRDYIRQTAWDIKFILHVRRCYWCRMEVQLSVERYLGRGLPWFFDIMNEIAYDDEEEYILERYKDMPRVRDYHITSYWEEVKNYRCGIKTSHKGTEDFIKARLDWAEKVSRADIMLATSYYRQLNSWDLNSDPPMNSDLPFL